MAATIVVQQYAVILKATLLILGIKEQEATGQQEAEEIQDLISRIQTVLGVKESMEKINIVFDSGDQRDKALFILLEQASRFGYLQFAKQASIAEFACQLAKRG